MTSLALFVWTFSEVMHAVAFSIWALLCLGVGAVWLFVQWKAGRDARRDPRQ